MHPENGYGMLRQMILQQISDFLKKKRTPNPQVTRAANVRLGGWRQQTPKAGSREMLRGMRDQSLADDF